MNSPRNDKAHSHVYREGAWPEPNRQIEQAIRSTDRGRRSFARRWALPFAIAAGAILAFFLLFRPAREQPRPIAGPAPAATGARVEPSPASPEAQKAAVESQSAPASARAPAPPSPAETPPYAMRRDEAERLGILRPDAGPKPGSGASESPPPRAPKAALKKEAPERERAPVPPTFVPTRPPQIWIEDIRKLRAEGKAEEAASAVAEFRKRNPDYVLPEDLR